jgi:5-methylcytosine-specific restriction endonuclease McrA
MEMKKLRDGSYRLNIYQLKAFNKSLSGRDDWYLGYETRDHLTFYADHPDDFINMICLAIKDY